MKWIQSEYDKSHGLERYFLRSDDHCEGHDRHFPISWVRTRSSLNESGLTGQKTDWPSDDGWFSCLFIPSGAGEAARLREKIEERIDQARARFAELAQSRTNLEEKQDEVIDLLLHWFVQGTKPKSGVTN